jgi:hypothetical protein
MQDVAGSAAVPEPVDALVVHGVAVAPSIMNSVRLIESARHRLPSNALESIADDLALVEDKLSSLAALAKAHPVKGGEEKGYDPKVHVPGVWRCAKCNFQLIQSTLNANSGAITARDEPSSCPNDGSPMWRVTWKEHAEEAYERYEERLEEFAASRARVEVLEAAWAWIAQNVGVELSWGDNANQDEGEAVWRVHRRNGPGNDREWTLLAEGETPLAAVQAALTEEKTHGG